MSLASPTEALHPLAERIGPETPAIQIVRALGREDERAVRAVDQSARPIANVAERAAQAFLSGGRLIYVGAGTSGRLGALDAAECPPTFGVPPTWVQAVIAGGPRALTRAVEGAEDRAADGKRAIAALKVGPNDVVCGISASGRARFVQAALVEAKKRKAFTVLITCNTGAPGDVDERITLDTGAELIAGSTRLKAGSATKLTLNAISTAAMARIGRIERGRMVALKATNAKLAERAQRIVSELAGVDAATAKALLKRAKGDVRKAIDAAPKKERIE
ncbi:MAG: N-acetylmuramic acid 6-phosphate etherase [Myxococcaceae bacterium]